ncbi:MAG: hypothetical protein AVDCRST_MAG73-4080, partial [uncultured Thermomicrobiales bacterium]
NPDLRVVAQDEDLARARAAIAAHRDIAVAVLDLDLPDGHGADLIRDLRAANPGAQALVLTASADRRDLMRAVEEGAAGVLHKSAPLGEIVAAVRRLAAGEWLLAPAELVGLLREAGEARARDRTARESVARLTPRERDVLALLAEGLSDKEIAARLSVGKDTVHTHMVNLLAKLGVESRLQALIVAVRQGLVSLQPSAD